MPNSRTKQGISNTPRQTNFTFLTYPRASAWPPRWIQAAVLPQRPVNQIKTTTSSGVQTWSPRPQLLEPPRELQELTPPPFTTPINQSPDDSHIWKGVGGVRPVPVLPLTAELWASLRRSAQNLHEMHKDNFTFHNDSQSKYKHNMLFYRVG